MSTEVLSLDDDEHGDGGNTTIRVIPLDSCESLVLSRQLCRYSKLLVSALQEDKEATEVSIPLTSDSLSRVIRLVNAIDEALSQFERSSAGNEKENVGVSQAHMIERAIRQHLIMFDDNVALLRDVLAAANYLDIPLLEAIALNRYQHSIRHSVFSIALIPKSAPQLLNALGIEYVGQSPPSFQLYSYSILTYTTSGKVSGQAVLLDVTRQLEIRHTQTLQMFNTAEQHRTAVLTKLKGKADECTTSIAPQTITQFIAHVQQWTKYLAQVRSLAEKQWQVWKDDVLPIFQVPCVQVWQDVVIEAYRKIELLDETSIQEPEIPRLHYDAIPNYVTCMLHDYRSRIAHVRANNSADLRSMYHYCINWFQHEKASYMDIEQQCVHMKQMLLILLRRTCSLLREYWVNLVDDLKRHSDEAMDHISILTRIFGHAFLSGYSFTGVCFTAMDPVGDRDVIIALLFILEQHGLEQMRTTSPVSSFQFVCANWQTSVHEPYRRIMWSHFRTELAVALHIPFHLREAFSTVSTMAEFVNEHCLCVHPIEQVHVLENSELIAATTAAASVFSSKVMTTATSSSAIKTKWGTREQFYAELAILYARKQADNAFAHDVLRYVSSAKACSHSWIISEVNVVSIRRVPISSSSSLTLLQHMHKIDTLFRYLDVYHSLSCGGWWYFVETDVRELLWTMNNRQWTGGLAGIHPQPPQHDEDERIKIMASAADSIHTPIEFDQRTEQQIIADRQAAYALKETARSEEKRRATMMKRQQEAAFAKKQTSKGKSK
jgi:hypothetical protein